MTRRQRFVSNLLLLVFGTLLGILVLELLARLLITARRPGKSGEQAIYTQFDPLLGWRNRPGSSVTYNRPEFQTTVEINRLGFRDLERSVEKPAGRQRIVVLGDSFVEAYAVERDEGLSRRMEMLANREGCLVDVMNAGVHGYSIDQEFLWYRDEGQALAADIVVMAVYYNDILHTTRDNYWGSLKPVLETRGSELVPINTPIPSPKPSTPSNAIPTRPAPRIEGSALKHLVGERLLTGAPRFYARLAGLGLVDPFEPRTVADELRVFKTRGLLSDIEVAWTRTEEIVRAFAGTVRARAATPVVAYVPVRFEVVDADWDLTQLTYSMNPQAWDRSLVARRLEAVAERASVPFLNFTEPLRSATGGLKGSPYFRYDGHWNAFGNDVAAKAAVEFLRSRSLLACER
jgi:hypothetical protein